MLLRAQSWRVTYCAISSHYATTWLTPKNMPLTHVLPWPSKKLPHTTCYHTNFGHFTLYFKNVTILNNSETSVVSASHFLRTRPMFSHSVMVSEAVSKLGCMQPDFVKPGMIIDRCLLSTWTGDKSYCQLFEASLIKFISFSRKMH